MVLSGADGAVGGGKADVWEEPWFLLLSSSPLLQQNPLATCGGFTFLCSSSPPQRPGEPASARRTRGALKVGPGTRQPGSPRSLRGSTLGCSAPPLLLW